jgi:signal transduction histidine kinase
MEVYIPKSQRLDVIGRLQNSFATMFRYLNFHIGSVRYTTEQTKLRNEEMERATRMAKEADKQKTIFIQNVSHQIRTPLNIIMGFSQVLSDAGKEKLSDEEMKSITDMMDHNSKHLKRMLQMLFDSSDTGLSEELNSQKHDLILCNDVAREAIENTNLHYPNLQISFQSELADDFCIKGNRLYLMRALRELLYNSAKYSDGQHVSLHVTPTDCNIQYIVEDTGKNITEADRETIFKFFTKVDDLTEGLGLGLPLAKRHAQNLGGDLILDTSYQEGCRFIIEVPI